VFTLNRSDGAADWQPSAVIINTANCTATTEMELTQFVVTILWADISVWALCVATACYHSAFFQTPTGNVPKDERQF